MCRRFRNFSQDDWALPKPSAAPGTGGITFPNHANIRERISTRTPYSASNNKKTGNQKKQGKKKQEKNVGTGLHCVRRSLPTLKLRQVNLGVGGVLPYTKCQEPSNLGNYKLW